MSDEKFDLDNAIEQLQKIRANTDAFVASMRRDPDYFWLSEFDKDFLKDLKVTA